MVLRHRDRVTTTDYAPHAVPPGERLIGLAGYVYDPDRPQPPGTVALHRWFSLTRQDYWTTTQHSDAPPLLTPDYAHPRLEGYVLPA